MCGGATPKARLFTHFLAHKSTLLSSEYPLCGSWRHLRGYDLTRSGPKRPAAAIGGDDFLGYMAQLDPFWFVDRR